MKVIGEVQKNKREKIIVSTNEYQGFKYVDLRIHYEDKVSGDYKPTQKGVALSSKVIPEIVELIVKGAEDLQGIE